MSTGSQYFKNMKKVKVKILHIDGETLVTATGAQKTYNSMRQYCSFNEPAINSFSEELIKRLEIELGFTFLKKKKSGRSQINKGENLDF